MNPNKYDHPDLKGGEEGPPVPSLEPRTRPPTPVSRPGSGRAPSPGGGRQTLLRPEGKAYEVFPACGHSNGLLFSCFLFPHLEPPSSPVSSRRGLGAAAHPPAWGRGRRGGALGRPVSWLRGGARGSAATLSVWQLSAATTKLIFNLRSTLLSFFFLN